MLPLYFIKKKTKLESNRSKGIVRKALDGLAY